MADTILNERASEAPPPLDTVLLWLTFTVEQDFERRQAFPELRRANARCGRGTTTLHYLTPDEAWAVLGDAIVRERFVSHGVRKAYGAHIRGIRAAVVEAQRRRDVFEAEAAFSESISDYSERWRGTKEQLEAKGIQLNGAWPGGTRQQWVRGRDWRGYAVNVKRFDAIWPGLYLASIQMPSRVATTNVCMPNVHAQECLASMPADADEYRESLIHQMRWMVQAVVEQAGGPHERHGYSLDEGAQATITASFAAVAQAVAHARVHFDAALHAKVALKHRIEISIANGTFDAEFASPVRPKLRLLQGGAE